MNEKSFAVQKTDEEWRAELAPFEFAVLRTAATEAPWSGELLNEDRTGVYRCKACAAELFRSETKFDAHCGWPSFYEPKGLDTVVLQSDYLLGYERVEVLCANCGSHLGHVFDDAPQTPTGQRYCMNSVALSFEGAE